MYELFDTEGHLTDFALNALSDEKLSELQRLEISEHLSFCDDCLIRYTNLLCDNVLIAPPKPLTQTVMQKIKSRARVIFINKYFSMTVAAGFAVTFWVTGIFTPQNLSQPCITAADTFSQSTNSIAQKAVGFSQNFSNGVNTIINDLFTKGDITNEKE